MMRKSVSGTGGGRPSTSRRSSSSSRSSLSSGRPSIAPLRVRNEGNVRAEAPSAKKHSISSGSRFSVGGRASFGGRLSMGYSSSKTPQKRGLTRGSGMGITTQNGIPKDPRKVSDKAVLHKCVATLVQFLSESGYPHNFSPKVLYSPPSKDFFRIFEFVYGLLEPNYKLGKKPEEDVPRIFKQCGYPFMISKSSMFAIGTTHTWPSILAALIWMVEIIKFGMTIPDKIDYYLFPTNEDEFDSIPETKFVFDYVEKTYVAFLQGSDTFDEYDEKLSQTLNQKYCGMTGGIGSLESDNKRLEYELEVLEQESDKLKTLQEQRAASQCDEQRFEGYLNELEIHKQGQEQQLKNIEEENAALGADLDSANLKIQQMQQIYETQEYSPADIDRIKMNRKELQRQIDDGENQGAEVDQEIWSEEMQMTKMLEKAGSVCSEYNKMAQKLKLIPMSAENACGVDYEIKVDYSSYSTNKFDVIKPTLAQLKQQCSDSVHKTMTAKMEQHDSLEQIMEYVSDVQDEINLIESRIKHTEDDLEAKKQLFQREHQQVQEEIESIQRELLNMETSSKLTVHDSEKEYLDAQRWAEQKQREMAKTEKDHIKFLERAVTEVVDHKLKIMNHLQEVTDEAEEKLKHMKSEKS